MELNFKKIELSDKKIIDFYFQSFSPKISEYTFTNLFMWDEVRNIKYSKLLDGIVFSGQKDNEKFFYPPIGESNCEKAFDLLVNYGIKNNFKTISLIPEYQVKFLKKIGVKPYPDRDNFDYIYKTEKLANLGGWKLDGKRWFIRKFKQNYNYTYRKFYIEDKSKCITFFERWLSDKENSDLAMEELRVFKKFLYNYENLSVTGGIIEVEGKIIAFEFGEPLDKETFVIHFEKADTNYIGSYQMINNLFVLNHIFPIYRFVNREQDMGIEGLRKAKLSYVPFKLLKKYEVSLNI